MCVIALIEDTSIQTINEKSGQALLHVSNILKIVLPVQLGWGGRWVVRDNTPSGLKLLETAFDTAPSGQDGTYSHQTFIFQAVEVGSFILTIDERRIFVEGETPRNTARYEIQIIGN
ncbi:protease inhibitor I42 family protein [Mesorhizobium sp. B2-5-3]|nr:protease inhibitor I42 family protein [Mesorhizobium sp. B2-5-3]